MLQMRTGRRITIAALLAVGGIGFSLAAESDAFGPALLRQTELGTILVGPNGMTLYTSDRDTPGVSNCQRECAGQWPAFRSDGEEIYGPDWTAIPHVSGLGAMLTEGMMWVFRGQPLYYYRGDESPGDINGDGVAGSWHVVVVEDAPAD